MKPKELVHIDYSKKENQIGCGYCAKESTCKIKDPKINKAKLGCEMWEHWQDAIEVIRKRRVAIDQSKNSKQ